MPQTSLKAPSSLANIAVYAVILIVAAIGVGTLTCPWQTVVTNRLSPADPLAHEHYATSREKAESEAMDAAQARAVLNFFCTSVFSAESAKGDSIRDLTIRTALEQAAGKAGKGVEDQPLVEAAIHVVVAQSLQQFHADDMAITSLKRAVELRKLGYGRNHPSTLATMLQLGVAYQRASRPDESLPVLQELLAISTKTFGPFHQTTFDARELMTGAMQLTGKLEQSESLLREHVRECEVQFSSGNMFSLRAKGALAVNYLLQGKPNEAEAILRQCVNILERTAPDQWNTLTAKSLLATSLIAAAGQMQEQNIPPDDPKFAEAEKLLLIANQGFKKHRAEIPAAGMIRVVENCQCLVRLYQLWGKSIEENKWQRELDAILNEMQK